MTNKAYIGAENFKLRDLPSGYTQVEYIQSSGTQYIDTGFKPNNNTRVVMDFQFVSAPSSDHAVIFGARDATNVKSFCVFYITSGYFRSDYNTTNTNQWAIDSTIRYTIDKNKETTSLNNTTQSYSATTFQCAYNMYLFGLNGTGYVYFRSIGLKVYSCQIYDNGTLIRDYVPCINADGAAGLYDMVNGAFYANAGTGSFTTGATYKNDIARTISKIYLGLDNFARKITKAYIGDENGLAMEWFTSHIHSYTTKVTAPTCTVQGYTTYTCSCGDSYKSDYTAAGHKYGTAYWSSEFSTGYGKKCSVCGQLTAVTPKLSNLDIGSSVYMNVDGAQREFLVVHQGRPSSVYDSSCNGTWLLMKDSYIRKGLTGYTIGNDYAASNVHSYLNDTFVNLFDSGIQSIIKQVKIPYTNGKGSVGTVSTGSSGLSAKVFLLSYTEVGFSGDSANVEGSILSYFNGADDSKRIAKFDGSAFYWWLRSPVSGTTNLAWCVLGNGSAYYTSTSSEWAVRPVIILPSSTSINGTLISKT